MITLKFHQLKKLIDLLINFLSDKNGIPSSIRLIAFWIALIFVPIIAFGFIWTLIYYPYLIISYLGVLTSLIFACLGLKVFQKDKE